MKTKLTPPTCLFAIVLVFLTSCVSQHTDTAQTTQPALPQPTQYNVHDFGAVGDGATKDTVAFQKALDTCAVNGGGEVLVPAGTYLIGSIQMGTRTIMRFSEGAVLRGSPDLEDYPLMDIRWEGRWQLGHRSLIYTANVDHTGIIGPGRIDGNTFVAAGQGGANPRGALVLEPISCNDVHWEGFTVTQGGNWAIHPTYCTDVVIKNMNISGRRDGIDVDSSKNVRIENCTIDTGDDSISLKSGRGMDGARLAIPCEDILITNCTLTCRTFACLGIGSETSGGVRNVRIEHCKLSPGPTSAAIYIKTRIGRAGVNENISGDDLDVLTGGFLRINLVSSGNLNTSDDAVEGLIGYPLGKNFSFSNVRVKCQTLVRADEISDKKPLQGLTLTNISGTCTKGITLANTVGVNISGINVTGFSGDLFTTSNVTGTGFDNPAAKDVTPAASPALAQ